MKIIKKLILSTLLVVTFSGRADDNIEDKLTCAADAITIHSMIAILAQEVSDYKNIDYANKRADVWLKAISKKLVVLGKTPEEVDDITKDAIRKSWARHEVIFKDKSISLTEYFSNKMFPLLKSCMGKYSKNNKQ
jgi:hypothetical protein